MAIRETRADRGRRRGRAVVAKLTAELVDQRKLGGLSQKTIGNLVGWSQPEVSRFERQQSIDGVSVVDLCQITAVLGFEFAASLHPFGDPIRDAGHQALIRRFRAQLARAWQVTAEMPLPGAGDRRSWDLGLRLVGQRVGVEAETAIRDIQRLVRHTRERESDGGMDEVVLLLADTRRNRSLLPGLLEALGERFQTSPRSILKALREGLPLPGSGVILL